MIKYKMKLIRYTMSNALNLKYMSDNAPSGMNADTFRKLSWVFSDELRDRCNYIYWTVKNEELS